MKNVLCKRTNICTVLLPSLMNVHVCVYSQLLVKYAFVKGETHKSCDNICCHICVLNKSWTLIVDHHMSNHKVSQKIRSKLQISRDELIFDTVYFNLKTIYVSRN